MTVTFEEAPPASAFERLPGVPPYKHERAGMAVRALWSAVARALEANEQSERNAAMKVQAAQ